MSGKSLAHKIWNFPSYSTILTQTFSPDGNHLALGNDRGIIAIFSVNDLLSSGRNANANDSGASCSFFFRALSHSQDVKFANGDSVNVLVSTKTFLVAAVSVRATNSAKIVAWNWADLIGSQASNGSQAHPKPSWTIESSSGNAALLPTEINAMVVDEDAQEGAAGRLYVAGGSFGDDSRNIDYAIRVIDLETRCEASSPLVGHTGYIHDVSINREKKVLASASEDGSVKLWDLRSAKRKGHVQEILPNKHDQLARKIGRWIGAVSLEGELLCCGGGPKAALYHLRTLTPMNAVGLSSTSSSQETGAVHFVDIFTDENKIAVGGEMENTLILTNLNGDLVAEIETSSSCVYTVAHQSTSTRKLMTIAGSSSKIDLCTANFCYKDCTVHFPVLSF